VVLLKPATPLRINKKHAEFGVTPHLQVHINAVFAGLQMFGVVDSLRG